MSVTKDFNVGTIVTVLLFLTAQSIGAVWWASGLSQQVSNIGTDFNDFKADNDAEQLRQWTRINNIEDDLRTAIANGQAFEAMLQDLRTDVRDLRQEQRETNALLRDFILKSATGLSVGGNE